MSNTLNLLQQVRYAGTVVSGTSKNPEHQAMLASADLILNELLLQESPEFYLDYISKGTQLLEEGQHLATDNGASLSAVQLRDDLNIELRNEVFDEQIECLHGALTEVVNALNENNSDAEKNYLNRLSSWEVSLYKRRGQQIESTTLDLVTPITQEMLQTYLEQKFPNWKGLKINSFTSLYGGFSKKTILFETSDELNGVQSIVLRVEQPINLICYDGCDVANEYHMIELMYKLGLPAAKPLWLEEDASHLGGRFIASVKASGEIRGDSLGGEDDLPDEVVDTMLDAFYAMHKLKIDPNDPMAINSHLKEWLPYTTISETTRHWVEVFIPNEIQRTGIKVTPDLARGLRWAQQNVPDCDEAPAILHMDYSFNNLLFEDDKISAILDWETSRIGDPIDDIIWTQHSIENRFTMHEFLAKYQQATGRKISEYRIAYSRVIKSLLNTIGALNALQTLSEKDSTPINFSFLAYKFMPILSVNLNELISDAEATKGK